MRGLNGALDASSSFEYGCGRVETDGGCHSRPLRADWGRRRRAVCTPDIPTAGSTHSGRADGGQHTLRTSKRRHRAKGMRRIGCGNHIACRTGRNVWLRVGEGVHWGDGRTSGELLHVVCVYMTRLTGSAAHRQECIALWQTICLPAVTVRYTSSTIPHGVMRRGNG